MKFTKHALRKSVSVVLVLMLLLSTLLLSGCGSQKTPNTTSENDSGSLGEGVEYSFNATSGKLTVSGAGDMKDFAKGEDAPWYAYRGSIEKIEIGENITSIGDYAFYHCVALEKIEIAAKALTSIGKYAFWMCSLLEEIAFPETLTEIGEGAFAYCAALSSVSVSNLATLGASAFAGCTALEVASFDGALAAIPEKAFMNCTALKTVAYPERVTDANIASDAFLNVSDKLELSVVKSEGTLTVLYLDEDGETLSESYSAVIAKGAEYSVTTPVLEGYTIPAGQETLSGVMPGADLELRVIYKKNAVESETSDPAETTPQGGAETEPSGGSEEPAQEFGPMQIAFIVLLVVIVGAIIVGAVLLMRSNKSITKDSQTVRKNGNGSNKSSKK